MTFAPRRAAAPAILASALLALGCARANAPASATRTPTVTRARFGVAPDGKPVDVFTLENVRGIRLRILTYGGIIQTLETPDRSGKLDDVVLGFDDLQGYVKRSPYFGAIVGRYGNRIARGRFTLEGKTYTLAVNNAPNHLHGGIKGFDKVVWDAEAFRSDTAAGVVLTHVSPDGDEGYPGTLRARVTYTLTNRDALVIDSEATTDRPTVVNLTNHTYWNLAGDGTRDILGHVLSLPSNAIVPVDSTLIPTGQLMPVAGTPFDFRTPTPVGARIDDPHVQIRYGRGYDHTFVLDRETGTPPSLAARVTEPTTGRRLDIYTTEPGVQVYSGNFLDGTVTGKRGRVYARRFGLALETHHYPDSPNQPSFPSVVLRPGETYRTRTVFRFGVTP
ncbi:MAG TPA: aldose epimerase family protein [Gemmatimonadaceae bacterium]|nr:aldose epimerase family protein [Gemmatimonadaceae bacterium]